MTKKAGLYHRAMGPVITQTDVDKLNEAHAFAAEHDYHFVTAQLDRSTPATESDSEILEELLESGKIDAIIITYPGSGRPIIWTREAALEHRAKGPYVDWSELAYPDGEEKLLDRIMNDED